MTDTDARAEAERQEWRQAKGATLREATLLDEIRAISKHLDIIDVQLPVQGQWIEAMQGIHAVLRELRGELAGIRTRLDSLVGIEKQLSYQGQRLSAIEKRLAALVETRVTPAPVLSTTFQSPPGPAG